MAIDDDNFDEELCEELALELVDQQEPVKPSTENKDSLPPTVLLTVPALMKNFVWGKKKGKTAVRAFFKDRQYLPDMKTDERKTCIRGLFQHARGRGRNEIKDAWLLPVKIATRADLHDTLEANDNCGELVLSQDAKDDAAVLMESLPNGYTSFSFVEGSGYLDGEGKPCSKKAWSKQNKTSTDMELFHLTSGDFTASQAEASQLHRQKHHSMV